MARLDDLLDEKDRLRELDGWQIRRALVALKRSLGVFEANSRELQAFLGHDGDARKTRAVLEMIDFSNRQGFGQFLDETDRLLHNFLAAAESLRDHAAAIQRAYLPDVPGDADTDEYWARERVVFNSSLGAFVTELRNHVLHDRIPETDGFAVWSSEPADLKSGIALKTAELLPARNWSKKARRYMSEAGDDILIHEIAADYRELVLDFYEWVDGAIRRRNEHALAELDSREARVGEALKRAWGPPIDDPMGVPNDPGV